jgi:hypothetical protein
MANHIHIHVSWDGHGDPTPTGCGSTTGALSQPELVVMLWLQVSRVNTVCEARHGARVEVYALTFHPLTLTFF